jgi:hypothetical protein
MFFSPTYSRRISGKFDKGREIIGSQGAPQQAQGSNRYLGCVGYAIEEKGLHSSNEAVSK